jgi:hypothetical protein
LLPFLLNAVLCGSAAAQFTGCPLNAPGGQIHHVVYIQFDNVHFERDNPNVPADLEQMPHLLNFMKNNGTLFANHHTPLISHTADDILTSLTGVYPDRHGQAVANSYVTFNVNFPATNKFWDSFPSSFTYWTDLVNPASDPVPNMIDENGTNAPAPWVPFTRFGCNVGAVSIADMELENTSSDITTVFGAGSPETKDANKAADFEGIAIHCALNDPLCSPANNGKPDLLPAEPGTYNGYYGLFGHKYVQPVIAPGGLNDLFGNPIPGFPGFGGISPAQTLAYIEAMLQNNVPIVFSYISDAHDCHAGIPGDPTNCLAGTFGSGEAGYVAQLKVYDQAFAQFFQDLANMGIDQTNTLFIISADEQDHQVAGPPSPANCDGVNIPCTYTFARGPNAGQRSVGEIEVDLPALYAVEFPSLVPDPTAASNSWDFHFDMAPAMYFNGFENADPGSSLLRQFEQATTQLTATNPITGNNDLLTRYIVDRVGLKALHMITADPNRTPNFVMFSNPDYYYQDAFSSSCKTAAQRESAACLVVQGSGFAWNHGGVAPEINTTWVGFVGPGVKNQGVDKFTWTDEVDTRPTILFLIGLQDDYVHDGRVITEGLNQRALSPAMRGPLFELLSTVYKQLNAPIGDFGQRTLSISTAALASGNATDDSKYTFFENSLASLTAQRDTVAEQIRGVLDAAAFQGQPIDPRVALKLSGQAQGILLEIDLLSLIASL